jgi:putative transposase
MVDIKENRNCVYQTAYHVVWCPRYRKSVLSGPIAGELNSLIDALCAENGWAIVAKEIQPDHIHLCLSFPPAISIAQAMKVLKGTTARKLFIKFPWLRKKVYGGGLWSPSYYAGTAGNVSAETIRRYIERTEHIKGRR